MMMLNGVSELEKALQFVGLGQGQAGSNTEAAGKKRRRRWRRRRRSISRWREGGGFQSTWRPRNIGLLNITNFNSYLKINTCFLHTF